jgi:predicted flap endonuclease-1-like 5' DNA nuclease
MLRQYAVVRECVSVKPADGPVRTRADAVVHAIEAAQLALEQHAELEQHGQTATQDASALLAEARAQLHRASNILTRPPKRLKISQSTATAVPVPIDGPDDLTRIRGIDDKATVRLNALGITRFEQIAAWQPEDVRVIGQALDLGRSFQNNGVVDQAKMLLAPQEMDGVVSDSMAGWLPRGPSTTAHASHAIVEPLTAAEYAAVHALLRQGPGKTELHSIAVFAPKLARLALVPDILADDVDDAPWRPSPLMETVAPSIGDWPQPDPTRAPPEPDPAPGKAEVAAEIVTTESKDEALEAQVNTATPPADKPLHVVTLDRIAALDAEITALSVRPNDAKSHIEPVPEAAVPPIPSGVVRAAPSGSGDHQPKPPAPRSTALMPPSEEADVTIKVRSSVRPTSMLQPIPELPLQPKRRIMLAEPASDAPAQVSEAAVVIVKRRARERAAPDLEFYKSDPTTTDTVSQPQSRKSKRVEGELAS